jgi:hypothetical protein
MACFFTFIRKIATMITSENQDQIFPKGDKAPAEYFTGTAWVKSAGSK